MGLYKRKDSQFYWMSFRVDGRRITESSKTRNKKLAEMIYAKKLTEITEGKWFGKVNIPNVTMEEIFDRYLKEISPNLSPTTDERNGQMVKNLRAFFVNAFIKDVTPSVVSRYKARRLEKRYSKETILRELGLLRRIFNIAIEEWELCRENQNPVPKVLRTLGKVDSKRVRYLAPGELERLMVASPSWLRPIITIARHTGLRRGNIMELTWPQVDLVRRIVTIPRTKNGLPIGIPLTQLATKTLAELRKVRYLHSSFVFCDDNGAPHTPGRATTAFRRACRTAEIENLRFHDLRHDFASNLVQAGVDIHVVKELLGHSDLRMTLRYCHLAPENLRSAVNVLDKMEQDREKESSYVLATFANKNGSAIKLTR